MKKESSIENLIEIKVETDVLKSVLEKEGLLKSKEINESLSLQNQATHIFKTLYSIMLENHHDKMDGDILQLAHYIKTFDINELLKPSLFSRVFKKENLGSHYLKVEEEVNIMASQLEKQRIQLTKEMMQFNRLLEETMELIQQFSILINTIKNKIEFLSEDSMNLHKKIVDLELTQSILKQIRLQIEMLIKTHQQLIDQLARIHLNILPMWKKYVANTLKVKVSLEEGITSFDKMNVLLLSIIEEIFTLNEQEKKESHQLMKSIK